MHNSPLRSSTLPRPSVSAAQLEELMSFGLFGPYPQDYVSNEDEYDANEWEARLTSGMAGERSSPDVSPGFSGAFGAEERGDFFGADKVTGVPHVSPEQLAKLIAFARRHRDMRRAAHERVRAALDPNMGLGTKIERYTFPIGGSGSAIVTLGNDTNSSGVFMQGQPATGIRAERLFINVPCPSFFYYTSIKVANVAISIGATGDAWEFNADAVNSDLGLPALTPADTFTIVGTYTGVVPPPYSFGPTFPIVASMHGPATLHP